EGELGLDTEPLDRADQILDVAESVFTPFERDALARLRPPDRRLRAVQLWTLKEAYMKARGMGFSVPVQSFEIDFAATAPALRFLPPIDDRPSAWQLEIHVVDEHLLSVCRAAVAAPAVVALRRADLAELISGSGTAQERRLPSPRGS